MNNQYVCCLDFETDSSNPNTCNPVQLSSLIIHPRTLEVVEGSEFNSFIKPEEMDKNDYLAVHNETIEWHAKIRKQTVGEILEMWKNAPSQKIVWANFLNYLEKYHNNKGKSKSMFTAPIVMGYNILKFDCVIIERLCQKYKNVDGRGQPNIFYPRDKVDLINYSWAWFENLKEPASYSMDVLREFLGYSQVGAHDSMEDVRFTAKLFIAFQKLHRKIAEKTQFAKAFIQKD
jgi:DNA polymerase III epsilon subunit-like protein